MRVVGVGFVDHLALLHDVAEAVGHPRVRRHAVAARAPRFLVVAFDALRQIEMGDEAHVRLVDAHAERDRRAHHDAFLALEHLLMLLARLELHARVIRQRAHALALQPLGGLFDLAARQAIDHARVGRAVLVRVLGADEIEQLRARIVLFDDPITNVRPIEARHEDARVVEREAVDDFVARDGVGGGRQRDARHVRKPLVQHRQLNVFGPEIVPPLRHAMRFVDCEQTDAARFPASRGSAASSGARARRTAESMSPLRNARSVAAASAPDSVEFRYEARTPTSVSAAT